MEPSDVFFAFFFCIAYISPWNVSYKPTCCIPSIEQCPAHESPPTKMALKQNEPDRGPMGRFLGWFILSGETHVERGWSYGLD